MNPLTVTWAPHIYTTGAGKIFNHGFIRVSIIICLRQMAGFTLLTRLAVERLFHPFQPFIMGQCIFHQNSSKTWYPTRFLWRKPSEYGNAASSEKKAEKIGNTSLAQYL